MITTTPPDLAAWQQQTSNSDHSARYGESVPPSENKGAGDADDEDK